MGKSRKRARSPSRAAEDGARGGGLPAAAASAAPAESVTPPTKTSRKPARKNRETSPTAESSAAPQHAAAEPVAPPAKTSRKHARKNRKTSPAAEPGAAPAPAAAEPAAAIARRKQKSELHGKTTPVDQARAKKRVLARDDDDDDDDDDDSDGDDAAVAVAEEEDPSAREIAARAKGKGEKTRAAKRAKKLGLAGRENGAEETKEQNDDGGMLQLPSEPAGSSTSASAKRSNNGNEKSKPEARKGTKKSEAGLETGTRESQEAASPGSEVKNSIRRKTVARSRPADKIDGPSSGRKKRNLDKGGTQVAGEKSKQVGQDSTRAAVAAVPRREKRNKNMDTKESEGMSEVDVTTEEDASAGRSTQEGEDLEKADDFAARTIKGSKSDESKMCRNEDAKGTGGKVGSRGVKVDTAVEVVPNNVKPEGRVKSWVKENDSGEGVHGKQKTGDCMKDKTKGAVKETPAAWNDWSQADFDGDAARKNKFMCLMGARKSGSADQSAGKREKAKVTSREEHGSTISPAASKHIQDHLQKQFEGGMAARRARQRGKHAGIGFKS